MNEPVFTRNAQITVDPIMLMYAFRHALGRTTYCVGDVADALITHVGALKPDWRQQIVQDIELAIRDGNAGEPRHVQRWRDVIEAMKRVA
jgi:hypothetical protein